MTDAGVFTNVPAERIALPDSMGGPVTTGGAARNQQEQSTYHRGAALSQGPRS
jgi:hypothetical protein